MPSHPELLCIAIGRFRSLLDRQHRSWCSVDRGSGSYSVHNGIPGYADIADVPYLDVAAATSKDNATLTLFCVNRDVSRDLDAQISLAGFEAVPDAMVELLHAENIYEGNGAIDPRLVTPVTRHLTFSGSELRYTFPRSSVTVITFHKR